MQSEELKPCPFCGGPASIEQYGDRSQSTIYNCDNCSCSLETGEEFNHGAQWNCRAEAALSAAEPALSYHCDICTVPGYGDAKCSPLCDRPAPAVAVKALQWTDKLKRGDREGFVCSSSGVLSYSIMLSRFRVYGIPGEHDGAAEFTSLAEAKAAAQADYEARIRSALSAQVQDVAGWQDIGTLEPKDSMIVMGWGEYRERDGFSPAFMRWYASVGGWSVSAMPFYPTHWMPLPAAPAKQEGKP